LGLAPLKGHDNVLLPSPQVRATSTGGFSQRQIEVKVWDARTGKEMLNLTADKASFRDEDLFFNRDGTRLILQSERSGFVFQTRVWDATPLPEKR
jgi:hypothetical protein